MENVKPLIVCLGWNNMAKRQRDWARRETERLRTLLGGKCRKCGTTENLEFDVIIPIGNDDHHNYEWSWRMSFYRKQLERKNLQLLCEKHNGKKQNSMELFTHEPPEEPF